jgi:hypothetical protein
MNDEIHLMRAHEYLRWENHCYESCAELLIFYKNKNSNIPSIPLCLSFQNGRTIKAPPFLAIFIKSEPNLLQSVQSNPYFPSEHTALSHGRSRVNHWLLGLSCNLCSWYWSTLSGYHLMWGCAERCLSTKDNSSLFINITPEMDVGVRMGRFRF